MREEERGGGRRRRERGCGGKGEGRGWRRGDLEVQPLIPTSQTPPSPPTAAPALHILPKKW